MTAALSLADTLDTIGDDEHDAPRESYKINGLSEAHWAARKLAAAHAKIGENHDIAQRYIDRAIAARDAANKSLTDDVAYFTGLLEAYHREVLADNPKAKSIPLDGATLKSRMGQPKWTVDDDAFIAWASLNGRDDLVRVKSEPNLADAKKTLQIVDGAAMDADGELVDGVTVTPAEPRFSIELT